MDEDAQSRCLESFKPFLVEGIVEGFHPTEDYCVVIKPRGGTSPVDDALEWPTVKVDHVETSEGLRRKSAQRALRGWQMQTHVEPKEPAAGAEVRFEKVILPRLDVHNLTVIATVLAQSVALDHYSVKVDSSAEIKLIFELTGDFELGREPIVFVSMRYIRNWYQI